MYWAPHIKDEKTWQDLVQGKIMYSDIDHLQYGTVGVEVEPISRHSPPDTVFGVTTAHTHDYTNNDSLPPPPTTYPEQIGFQKLNRDPKLKAYPQIDNGYRGREILTLSMQNVHLESNPPYYNDAAIVEINRKSCPQIEKMVQKYKTPVRSETNENSGLRLNEAYLIHTGDCVIQVRVIDKRFPVLINGVTFEDTFAIKIDDDWVEKVTGQTDFNKWPPGVFLYPGDSGAQITDLKNEYVYGFLQSGISKNRNYFGICYYIDNMLANTGFKVKSP